MANDTDEGLNFAVRVWRSISSALASRTGVDPNRSPGSRPEARSSSETSAEPVVQVQFMPWRPEWERTSPRDLPQGPESER